MRTIYERAESVLVWLGPSIERADLAFALFEELYQHRNSKKDIDKILRDEYKVNGLKAMRDLLERGYWERLWIVQEINSARNITILCGRYKIDWLKVVAVQNTLLSDHESLMAQQSSTGSMLVQLDNRVIFWGPKSLELPRCDHCSSLPLLYSLLAKFWSLQTSDPRDKIYALVGLSSARDDPGFVIDYSASIHHVYIDVTKYILLSSRKLNIVCSTQRSETEINLPSWVPNWVLDRRRHGVNFLEMELLSEGRLYNAAGTSTAEFELQHGDQILIPNGFLLSCIQSVGVKGHLKSRHDFYAGIHILLSWYKLCTAIKAPTLVQEDAFCRTISFVCSSSPDDRLGRMERCAGAIAMQAAEICPKELVDPEFMSLKEKYNIEKWRAERWLKEVYARIRRRRFFISDSNLIGMGPESAESGDIICILLGCSVPVVLRPQNGHYIFLGEAYIYGYMYRKAMEELAEGKFRLEPFEIH
jgi:hypothetical protein